MTSKFPRFFSALETELLEVVVVGTSGAIDLKAASNLKLIVADEVAGSCSGMVFTGSDDAVSRRLIEKSRKQTAKARYIQYWDKKNWAVAVLHFKCRFSHSRYSTTTTLKVLRSFDEQYNYKEKLL
jgi:hypothetical protein